MMPALKAARGILEGASLPVLQRVLEALEGRHAGPVTRMRARTRARAHAIPPPLLAQNPYKTRAAGSADGRGETGGRVTGAPNKCADCG